MKSLSYFFAVPALVLALVSHPGIARAEVIRVTREVPNFNKIGFSLAGNIEVRRGSACKLELEGERDVLARIETEVSGGTLNIEATNGKSMNNSGKIKYFLTMTSLSAIDLSGAGNITVLDSFDAPVLKLDLSGAGNVSGNFKAGNVKIDLSGTGNVQLKGSADNLKADLSGVGKLEATEMQTKQVKVSLSGVGKAEVYPTEALEADVSGMGSVRYKGTPKSLRKEVSGMGSVKPL